MQTLCFHNNPDVHIKIHQSIILVHKKILFLRVLWQQLIQRTNESYLFIFLRYHVLFNYLAFWYIINI